MVDDIWSMKPDLKEFCALTSGIALNSNVFRIAWLEQKEAQNADLPSTSQSPPNNMPQMSPAHSERALSTDAPESPSIDMDDQFDVDYEDQDFEMSEPSKTTSTIEKDRQTSSVSNRAG